MERTEAVSAVDTSKEDEGPPRMRSTSPKCKSEEDPLKFAPIHGPVVTSPQQYIPAGYCLLECSRCGGVDGMQIDIDICVYCADKIREMNDKVMKKRNESRNQGTQTEWASFISK